LFLSLEIAYPDGLSVALLSFQDNAGLVIQEILGRTNRLLSFDTTRITEKTKNREAVHNRQQGDLTRLLTKIMGDTETVR
jgi:hypothetical protein